YYLTTISGHQFWGAHTQYWSWKTDPRAVVEFDLPIALFLLTIGKAAFKLLRRTAWETADWVLISAATFVPLFYQVVLDRMDPGHVVEVYQAVLPLVLLWAIQGAE